MTREEAREILTHNWTRVDNPNYSESELDEAFFMAIEALSRPKGEWKCMADCGVTECDQCGWNVEEYVGDYNYCPNCGARMIGGDDE